MSTQFMFSAVVIEIIGQHSKLSASVIFNKTMVEHYQQLTTRHGKNRSYLKQFFTWQRMKMYERKLSDAILTEFLNEINQLHHGPTITISA